jgi:hypothetical protein
MESRGISNINLRSRLKQILLLVLAIFIGVLISQAVQAQHQWPGKSRYHRQIKSNRVCSILSTKRNKMPKAPLFASNRKPRQKAMAEID